MIDLPRIRRTNWWQSWDLDQVSTLIITLPACFPQPWSPRQGLLLGSLGICLTPWMDGCSEGLLKGELGTGPPMIPGQSWGALATPRPWKETWKISSKAIQNLILRAVWAQREENTRERKEEGRDSVYYASSMCPVWCLAAWGGRGQYRVNEKDRIRAFMGLTACWGKYAWITSFRGGGVGKRREERGLTVQSRVTWWKVVYYDLRLWSQRDWI